MRFGSQARRFVAVGVAAFLATTTLAADLPRARPESVGIRVVVDPVAAGNLTSAGTFGWSGAASTHFIVDRDRATSSRRSCIRPSSTDAGCGWVGSLPPA